MKRAILIGFSLAVATSSAYAYVVTSVIKATPYYNTFTYTYNIKCNNGATKILYTKTERYDPAYPMRKLVQTYLIQDGNGIGYSSSDAAAKIACGEK